MQRLGFVPPVGVPPKAPRGTMTNVVGYFSPNPWPLQISLSSTGVSLLLERKGDFVKDSQGRKINDPILEQYVGPGMLSRETSSKPVPMLLFAPQALPAQNNATSVHVATNARQMNAPASTNPASFETLAANHNSCVGMTMEQALKLKLVRPTITPKVTLSKDTDGQPPQGESLAYLDDTIPRDMKPGEYQRWLAQQRAGIPPETEEEPVEAPVDSAPEVESTPVARPVDPDGTLTAPVAEPATETAPEAPDTSRALVESLAAAASDQTVIEDAVAAALGAAPKAPRSATDVEPDALPKPNLSGPAAPQEKYVCEPDGRRFAFRSQLLQYARQKYPGRVDEIMKPYPKK